MTSIPSFTSAELDAALTALGIGSGQTVMVHSSVMHLGLLQDCPPEKMPTAIVSQLRRCLGPDGTLCSPAANWDFGAKKIPFDIKHSPIARKLGILPRAVLAEDGCRRSYNPIFSVAAVGPKADFICDGGTATAMGLDSAWDRLFQLDAEMLFLGCSLDFMSFIRYMEFRFGVPYLYNKLFSTPILDDGATVPYPALAPLRYANLPLQYDASAFTERLRARGILRETTLGCGTCLAVRMAPCFAEGIAALKDDIHFFLAHPPAYHAGQVPFD